MNIFDCFMYYDEDLVLDLRLNILNNHVSKFIIVESKFTHSGERRNLHFDINKYSKFKNKIEYFLLEEEPKNLFKIEKNDKLFNEKIILNGNLREFFQRNSILLGLKKAEPDDLIIISDVDEIPQLNFIKLNDVGNDIVFFNQIFCCYKFNLFSKMNWHGSRMIKKKI